MEDARYKTINADETPVSTTFVTMQRLNYIRGLDAHDMAEMMDGCADYCERHKAGAVQCTETSCVGCIEKWLNEMICVPVIVRKEEITCEK